jgi:hypothetical protein
MTPGKKPASASPSRKRRPMNDHGPCTSAMAAEISPQVAMIRAIHSRAPKRSSIRLLGISIRK